MTGDITVVGSTATGKTTLLQTLEQKSRPEEDPVSTVGINHFRVSFCDDSQPPVKSKSKCFPRSNSKVEPSNFVDIRELGGALAPNWESYIKTTFKPTTKEASLVYLIDASNPQSISEAGIHLVDCLSWYENAKIRTGVLIVYSKVDLLMKDRYDKTLIELKALLRISYLRGWCMHCTIQEVEYSAVTGQGLGLIDEWLESRFKN